MFGDRIDQLDIRIGKLLRFGRTRTNLNLDIVNALNSNDNLAYSPTFSADMADADQRDDRAAVPRERAARFLNRDPGSGIRDPGSGFDRSRFSVRVRGRQSRTGSCSSDPGFLFHLGMSRLFALLGCTAFVLACPFRAHAQVKDSFVQALVQFVNAANGVSGDEGPALVAAIEAMADGLAQWDAAIGRMESGLGADIGAASPPMAARMAYRLSVRRTSNVADWTMHLRSSIALRKLDPMFGEVHVFRGLAQELANRPTEAAEAWRVAWEKQPENLASAYRARLAGRTASDTTLVDATSKVLATRCRVLLNRRICLTGNVRSERR